MEGKYLKYSGKIKCKNNKKTIYKKQKNTKKKNNPMRKKGENPLRLLQTAYQKALHNEKNTIKRRDIFLADLSPHVGSEQSGVRPVLIIQNDIGNKYSPTVIVAAITSKQKNKIPTHVSLSNIEGISEESVVMLEQIRTIDKKRLIEKIGTVDIEKMEEINQAIRLSLKL